MKSVNAKFLFVCLLFILTAVHAFSQTTSTVQVNQGFQQLQNENFESAINIFSNILQAEPENKQARLGLAIALTGIEKFSEASREVAKLLARSPDDLKLLEMAAQLFWQQKRYVEAEIILRRRISKGNLTAEIWALFGDVLEAQRKSVEAVVPYENAVKLKPDSINFRYALGSVYWKQTRYEDAEREYLEILRREPGEPRASFNLGDVYLSRGDAAKALPLLENAVKTFPEEFDTRFALGRAFLLLNKYQSAVEEFEKAIKIRPDIPEVYYQFGLALQKNGQKTTAAEAFKKAKQLQDAKRQSETTPLNSNRKIQ